MKDWLVINRYGDIVCDTDNCDQAWDVCEVNYTGDWTVVSSQEYGISHQGII